MNTRELQDRIIQLKKEKDVCILVHAYQSHDIWEIADYVGDSYGLSVEAAKAPQKTIIMCGVRFMAETVKVLSPQKRVYLANPLAGCPMADQIDEIRVRQLKKQYPGYAVVAYVNTTAKLKTEVDVVVTSSSALKIVEALDAKQILFVPDYNLGTWILKQVKDKEIVLFKGGCPSHMRARRRDVELAKKAHPHAKLLVHPESLDEVVQEADYIGSTTGIMSYAEKSNDREFIIGTENSIIQHLQFSCPDKKFYPLTKDLICQNMKLTTLGDVYAALMGEGGEEIILEEDVITGARQSIDKMIELGG